MKPTFLLLLVLAACGPANAGGIHARFGYSEEGGLRVVDVAPAGPAAQRGLRSDDRIIRIDGEDVRRMSLREAALALRGPVGTEVELVFIREGEEHQLAVPRIPYRQR